MGFRIDTIRQIMIREDLRWEISFKGVEGRGEYATYYSGNDGRGLFTCEFEPGGVTWQPVLNSERVYVPPNMNQEEVWALTATWMKLQGWGPELDQRHQVVKRGMAHVASIDDDSGDFMLVFTPELTQLLGWEEGQKLDLQVKHGNLVIKQEQP